MRWFGWLIAGTLALALYSQITKTKSLESQLTQKDPPAAVQNNAALTESPTSSGPIAQGSPVDQSRCAKESKEFFLDYKRSVAKLSRDQMEAYVNHYDPRNGVCYVQVSILSAQKDAITTVNNVFNANENNELATYIQIIPKDKAQYEVKPQMCNVKLPNGETKICKADDEYDDLVRGLYGIEKP